MMRGQEFVQRFHPWIEFLWPSVMTEYLWPLSAKSPRAWTRYGIPNVSHRKLHDESAQTETASSRASNIGELLAKKLDRNCKLHSFLSCWINVMTNKTLFRSSERTSRNVFYQNRNIQLKYLECDDAVCICWCMLIRQLLVGSKRLGCIQGVEESFIRT
jgi:hypothetical protein